MPPFEKMGPFCRGNCACLFKMNVPNFPLCYAKSLHKAKYRQKEITRQSHLKVYFVGQKNKKKHFFQMKKHRHLRCQSNPDPALFFITETFGF